MTSPGPAGADSTRAGTLPRAMTPDRPRTGRCLPDMHAQGAPSPPKRIQAE